MRSLLLQVYQALTALPCAVTRAWPQTLVPLPAIAFSILSAQTADTGGTRCRIGLEVRAATPEAADQLAASAQAALAALGFALSDWSDGAVTDSGCFTVTLRLTGVFAADGTPVTPMRVMVAASGTPVTVGGVIAVEPFVEQRVMTDITQPADPVCRYAPQALALGQVVFAVRPLAQDMGQSLLRTAFGTCAALAVTLPDLPMGAVSAQGYVQAMRTHGALIRITIQLTG